MTANITPNSWKDALHDRTELDIDMSDVQVAFEPWIIIHYMSARENLRDNPLAFAAKTHKLMKQVKFATGYHWNNRNVHMRWNSHLLHMGIYVSEKSINVSFNTSFGSELIAQAFCTHAESSTDEWKAKVDEMFRRVEQYTKGIYHCSDCDAEMTEIAGRYFAGIYCEKCWAQKWKAIEAKETYN